MGKSTEAAYTGILGPKMPFGKMLKYFADQNFISRKRTAIVFTLS